MNKGVDDFSEQTEHLLSCLTDVAEKDLHQILNLLKLSKPK